MLAILTRVDQRLACLNPKKNHDAPYSGLPSCPQCSWGSEVQHRPLAWELTSEVVSKKWLFKNNELWFLGCSFSWASLTVKLSVLFSFSVDFLRSIAIYIYNNDDDPSAVLIYSSNTHTHTHTTRVISRAEQLCWWLLMHICARDDTRRHDLS